MRIGWANWVVAGALLGVVIGCGRAQPRPTGVTEIIPGLGYTNIRVATVPWSIPVVRIDRTNTQFALQTVHARSGALGLAPLSEQLASVSNRQGTPVAGVNGDFYQRDRDFAGDPRGLQIAEGELLSGPNGGVAFWVDARGQPQASQVVSQFQVTWPNGSQIPFGLNSERSREELVLYTPAIGTSTPSESGREWVLEIVKPSQGALAVGESVETRVREVRESGKTTLRPGTLVLSAGPVLAKRLPPIAVGERIQITTGTVPELRGARLAIGGGPLLVHQGRPLRIHPTAADSYEFSSMLERHPRSAVGWNSEHLFLVTVDGRQERLSVGMTLDELGEFLASLGCTEAMNLDGGGSATLWCAGAVRNSPCDGEERPIANALVVVRGADVPAGRSAAEP